MPRKPRLWLKIVLFILVLGLIAIQLVPVERTNPPVTAEIQLDSDVGEQLRLSCYDCHSNETNWPWYAWIAPVSWLAAGDVNEGREHLNFSVWADYPVDKRIHLLEEMREEIAESKMPMKIYLLLHGEARLDTAGREALINWARKREQILRTSMDETRLDVPGDFPSLSSLRKE
jgi:hypothetical protein